MVLEDFFGAGPVDVHRLLHVYVLARCFEIPRFFSSFFPALLKKRSTLLLIPAETRLKMLEEWLDEL